MTQHLDLDALQAELQWCIDEGHSGPRTHACLKSMRPLIDRLRKAEAASKWLPIETAPKDGSLVLLAAEFDCSGDWRKKVGGYWDCCWHVFGASWEPTRWMPLPPDPIGSDMLIAAHTAADSEGANRAD